MPKNQANHVNQAEQDSPSWRRGTSGSADGCGEESLTAIAERLEQWRSVADEVLGVLIVGAGSCLDETVDPERPGWLFDLTTDPGSTAQICAACPVRDACLELELRLLGAQKHGMWGALGEDGRRALHPVWAQRRGNVVGSDDPPGRARRRDDLAAVPDDEGWWR